jgi:hypothetical protein
MTEVGINSRRARLRLAKPPNQATRTLADLRIQWSVVLLVILVVVVVPDGGDCLQSRTSQSVTVQANLRGSSNIAGSRTPRGTTPIQRIQGANPIPRFQPTNITRATNSTSSWSPGTWTPIKRVGPIPIQGPSTQDARQLHGAKNIINQISDDLAEVVPTHNNAPLTSTTGVHESGKPRSLHLV